MSDHSKLSANSYQQFLLCPTPVAWLHHAVDNLPTLLIDHAHCELKAASTALSLIFKYPQYQSLSLALSKLAREELLHFEKVMAILEQHQLTFQHFTAARYAAALMKHVRGQEPERIIDILIIGAIIEARSCERFEALIPHLPPELGKFYHSLVKSEARHFTMYLSFAKEISTHCLEQRVNELLMVEKTLIESPDTLFRFHSGPLAETMSMAD